MIAQDRRLVIAIGGNAIHPGDIRGTVAEQRAIAERTADVLLPIMRSGCELILTHGNGPVVGKILMRQALAGDRVAPMSMDICVAHSQGGIAYLLMQALENSLRRCGDLRQVVSLLTQVEVAADDPAFTHPDKPIGFFYSEQEAQEVSRQLGWVMAEDAGRGWRHVVPSPQPKHIVDVSLIAEVAASGAVTIAGGGGGIPVVRNADGTRYGVEAVVDKDRCSALLADVLDADTLLMLTAVHNVAVNLAQPDEFPLHRVSVAELSKYMDEGQFAAGSMEPKIEAAIQFVSGGPKRRAIIAHLFDAEAALRGDAGTEVVAS